MTTLYDHSMIDIPVAQGSVGMLSFDSSRDAIGDRI